MNKLLVITDNEAAGDNICKLSQLYGYEFFRAPLGINGIEIAKNEIPSFIICDVSLPDMDGYCVSNILNKNPLTENIPVLLLNLTMRLGAGAEGKNKSGLFTKVIKDTESFISSSRKEVVYNGTENKEYFNNLNSLLQLLSSATPDKLDSELVTGYRTRSFNKRENIYFEDDSPNMVYLVKKGKIKTVKLGPEGKEFIIGIHEKGEFFGYIAVLEDNTYPDTAIAVEESEVLLIPKDDFLLLLNSDHQLGRHFIKLLANDISDIEERLMTLAFNSVRARVAGALLQLKKKHLHKKDVNTYTLHVSREDLAGLIGTTTESLIRTLTDFKHENIVDTDIGEIKILDAKSLEKIRRLS